MIRARLKKKKQLKLAVGKRIGKAFDSDETERLIERAKISRSPHMYPAFMLARNAGLRDTEIKTLTWAQVNLTAKTVQVGKAKTDAGEGRIVPLNSELYDAPIAHRDWYLKRFGATNDEWYLFPWGKPRPSDPTRHVTSLKTAWKTMRSNAKVKGRWHDNRHTLITELAESGAGAYLPSRLSERLVLITQNECERKIGERRLHPVRDGRQSRELTVPIFVPTPRHNLASLGSNSQTGGSR